MVLFCHIWSYLVHFGSIWSTLILFDPIHYYLVQFGLIQSTLVLFSPHCFYSNYSVYFSPIWSIMSILVLFGSLQSYLDQFPYSVHFHPIWFTLVLLCQLQSIRFNLIQFYPFWSTLAHFDPFRSIWSFLCTYIVAKDKFELSKPILNPNYKMLGTSSQKIK